MTQPKPLPEIARCADSKTRGTLLQHGSRFYVASKGLAGWRGPDKRTSRAAILAWNLVMGAVADRKAICDRIETALRDGLTYFDKTMAGFNAIDKIRRGE